ncbi:hypothetical protein Tco_1128576, partial [Tanacetum coccineum]
EFTLSSLEVLQGFSFFLLMGFTLILATFDGLDVGLLEDVIGEDECDDDDCDKEMSLGRMLVEYHLSVLHLLRSGNDWMRRISLRNSLVGNGYMVNLLVKVTGG